MDIKVMKGEVMNQESALTVLGIYEGELETHEAMQVWSEEISAKVKEHAQATEFEGKNGQSLFFSLENGRSALLIGLGEKKDLKVETVRQASGLIVQIAKKLEVSSITIELFGEQTKDFDAKTIGQAMCESLLLANYSFTRYKESEQKVAIEHINIVTKEAASANKVNRLLDETKALVAGVNHARDLVNTPAGDMAPQDLASAAQKIAQTSGNISLKVLGKKACEKLGMGSYLSVAEGSEAPPQFIHLTYTPDKKAKKRVAVVGKGVTFDSGGYSIKPSNGMMTMKCDMAGAAAVLGLFASLDALQPSVEVHGIIAATENMINGRATRPGDVVTASNGKTIEILNTDAEGRLTLADALHYASELEPDYTIDLATLTGAAVVALGEEISGLMGNDDDLKKRILMAAEQGDEAMWPMPLPASYAKLMKSDIADLRNISRTRYGGSLTAGLFLQNFVAEGMKWAHIDIAGPAFAERPIGSYLQKGATGYGVRTLAYFLKSL